MTSMVVATVIVYGVGRFYRPLLDPRIGAICDLILWGVLTVTIVKIFRRFED